MDPDWPYDETPRKLLDDARFTAEMSIRYHGYRCEQVSRRLTWLQTLAIISGVASLAGLQVEPVDAWFVRTTVAALFVFQILALLTSQSGRLNEHGRLVVEWGLLLAEMEKGKATRANIRRWRASVVELTAREPAPQHQAISVRAHEATCEAMDRDLGRGTGWRAWLLRHWHWLAARV